MIKDFDLLQRANNDYTTIDLEHAEELAYRELIDSIRYISLGDECGVMGNIANIITYKILEMRDYMDMLWYCQKVMKIFLKGIVIYLFK